MGFSSIFTRLKDFWAFGTPYIETVNSSGTVSWVDPASTYSQDLSLTGNTLGLSESPNTVDLSPYTNNWTEASGNVYRNSGSVGIGTTTPDASALLELNATDKGLLIPRMTSTQLASITTPANGLMIYTTDDQCINTYNGMNWLKNCGKTYSSGTLPPSGPTGMSELPALPAAFEARSEAVAFTLGNKAYVGTGDFPNYLLKIFWSFNGNQWVQEATPPSAFQARGSAVAFTLGNKAYVGTGYASNSLLKDFWSFDGTQWVQEAALPAAFQARNGAVAFTLGNKAYVGTGFSSTGSRLKDFWSFDGTQWVQEAALPAAFQARNGAVAFTLGNKAYVGTGFGINGLLKDLWSFDGTQWVQEAALPAAFQARVGAVAFTFGNKAYVGTGSSSTGLKDFWSFDGNQWLQEAALPSAFQVRDEAVAFTLGNKAYVGTGFGGGFNIYEKRFLEIRFQ